MAAEVSHLYSPAAMPIYEYRCENGHLFEVRQRITDDPVTACEQCGATVQRVFHPVAVHFKGSGFYNTDYGTAKRKRELERSGKDGADKHDAKRSETKSDSSSSSSGDGGSSGSNQGSSEGSSSSGSDSGSGSSGSSSSGKSSPGSSSSAAA
jgi:putative FmdB family regulatory protein